jgi:hypothetical protein
VGVLDLVIVSVEPELRDVACWSCNAGGLETVAYSSQRVQTFRKRANKSVASQLRRVGPVYAGSLRLKLSMCGNWILDTLCSLCAICSLPLVCGSGTCKHQAPLASLAVHRVCISSRRQSGLKAPLASHTFEILKPAPSFTLPAIPFRKFTPCNQNVNSLCCGTTPKLYFLEQRNRTNLGVGSFRARNMGYSGKLLVYPRSLRLEVTPSQCPSDG